MPIVARISMLVAVTFAIGLTTRAAYAERAPALARGTTHRTGDDAWRPHISRADSLVRRITASWGDPPASGWCVDWLYSRGDTSTFDPSRAEIAGSERSGVYTVTFRPAAFAPPTLMLRVRIGAERARLVTARAIARGDALADDDVLFEHSIVWGMPTIETAHLQQVIGTVTRRTLRAGEAIRPTDVVARPVVAPGDTVRADITRDGVTLSLQAIALRAAPVGARIPVRVSRGRQFIGTVMARSYVKVD
jgi:flagella basal body P-ring formation protein FlgA